MYFRFTEAAVVFICIGELVNGCEYLLKKAGRSEELINFVQYIRWSLLDLPDWLFRRLDVAIAGYLTKQDIVAHPDYTALAIDAQKWFIESVAQYRQNPNLLHRLKNKACIFIYLLEKAGWSKELFNHTYPAKLPADGWYSQSD